VLLVKNGSKSMSGSGVETPLPSSFRAGPFRDTYCAACPTALALVDDTLVLVCTHAPGRSASSRSRCRSLSNLCHGIDRYHRL